MLLQNLWVSPRLFVYPMALLLTMIPVWPGWVSSLEAIRLSMLFIFNQGFDPADRAYEKIISVLIELHFILGCNGETRNRYFDGLPEFIAEIGGSREWYDGFLGALAALNEGQQRVCTPQFQLLFHQLWVMRETMVSQIHASCQ
jgi:hypothetical protein